MSIKYIDGENETETKSVFPFAFGNLRFANASDCYLPSVKMSRI